MHTIASKALILTWYGPIYYLSNRYKRININKNFGWWSQIIFEIPQGSTLGSPLFNIYVSDLFCMTKLTDACNFTDDATFHSCYSRLDDLTLPVTIPDEEKKVT